MTTPHSPEPAVDGGGAPPKRPRVIFVASLAHSGSTLLQQLLAAHPAVLGVGEAFQSLVDGPLFRCPCVGPSSHGARCPVWGSLLQEHRHGDGVAGYEHLLDGVARQFPHVEAVVDESKKIEALRALLAADADVDVVLLVRDVRSWTVSTRDRADEQDQLRIRTLLRKRNVRGLVSRRELTGWRRFTVWQRRNHALEQFLERQGLIRIRVGYEVLATAPERELRRICDALSIDFRPEMLVPANGTVHMVQGNYGNTHEERAGSIAMSTRWLSRREWMLPSLLRRDVMAENDRLVYDREPS